METDQALTPVADLGTASQVGALIGLGHWARVGKDSLARQLVARHGFTRLAFADLLRELAPVVDPELQARLDGYGGDWEAAKAGDPYVRASLQRVGESVRGVLGPDVWVKALALRIPPGGKVVISDVRYRQEASFIKRNRGFLVKMTRPGVTAANGHTSEHDLDDWAQWDAVVENSGPLEALEGAADWVMARLGGAPRHPATETDPGSDLKCSPD